MSRAYNIDTGAVIDIKGIAECNVLELNEGKLTIGAAVILTQIAEINFFPALSLAVKRIADHTVQDKITIGGNIAGTIIYRESVLPLLASDSKIVIASPSGRKEVLFKDEDKINIAFSGVCYYPFRYSLIEDYLNDNTMSSDIRINNVINNIPGEILSDLVGSSDFRKFMLNKMLLEILEKDWREE